VGDNLHLLEVISDPTYSVLDDDWDDPGAYANMTASIYNYFRDLENLAIDFDFLLYQAHTDVIADIKDRNTVNCICTLHLTIFIYFLIIVRQREHRG
jgi:hypothetical protein